MSEGDKNLNLIEKVLFRQGSHHTANSKMVRCCWLLKSYQVGIDGTSQPLLLKSLFN